MRKRGKKNLILKALENKKNKKITDFFNITQENAVNYYINNIVEIKKEDYDFTESNINNNNILNKKNNFNSYNKNKNNFINKKRKNTNNNIKKYLYVIENEKKNKLLTITKNFNKNKIKNNNNYYQTILKKIQTKKEINKKKKINNIKYK